MRILPNMSIGGQIRLGYFLLLAVLAPVAFIGYYSNTQTSEDLDVVNDVGGAAGLMLRATSQMATSRAAIDEFRRTGEDDVAELALGALAAARDALQELQGASLGEGVAAEVEALIRSVNEYEATYKTYIEADAAARAARRTAAGAFDSLAVAHRELKAIAGITETNLNIGNLVNAIGERSIEIDRRVAHYLTSGDTTVLDEMIDNMARVQSLAATTLERTNGGRPSELAARVQETAQVYAEALTVLRSADADMHAAGAELERIAMALNTDARDATQLVLTVQEETGAHASQAAEESSLIVLALSAVALGLGAVLALMISRSISRAIVATREATTRLAAGDLDLQIKGADARNELGDMARALAVFRENASVQIAVNAAVQSSRTAFLLLDQDGDVISCNAAFDELWDSLDAKVSDLTQPGRRRIEGNGAQSKNFAPLLEKADRLLEAGAQLKSKNNGDLSLDVSHGDLTLELKRTPIVNTNGENVGTAIEISDVTSVRQIELELIEMIDAVEQGNFETRVTAIDHLGFTSVAAQGLNNLMDAISLFMKELDLSLTAMASGDLTRPIDGAFCGDFRAAADGFNHSIASLRETIETVEQAAEIVRRESDPIAAGSSELASRTESQASTLQQTVATIEEIAGAVRQTSSNAENSVNLSNRACEMAEGGGAIVRDTVDAMGRIEESSVKIGDIISVIEGIAFQTNLLALNAAVEAARAGDAGKGFAVVASEVRTLAQRSSEAARDIKSLIETSACHVSDGVSLVNRTGDSLAKIVTEVRTVAGTISEISTLVKEQASGVGEINSSITHLDEMTQRNAAMADQSASSARRLFDAASELSRLIAQFKTRGEEAGDRAA